MNDQNMCKLGTKPHLQCFSPENINGNDMLPLQLGDMMFNYMIFDILSRPLAFSVLGLDKEAALYKWDNNLVLLILRNIFLIVNYQFLKC